MGKRTYSSYEKNRAVDLAAAIGVPKAAKQLGIPESTLRSWGAASPKRYSAPIQTAKPTHAPPVRKVEDVKPPVYLRWYAFVILAVVGFFGVTVTAWSLLLWPVDIVLIVMRIRWEIGRWKDRRKAASAPAQSMPVPEQELPVVEPTTIEPEQPVPETEQEPPVVEQAAIEPEQPTAEPEAPVVEPPTPEPEPVSSIKKYASDYHYDDVKLCALKDPAPDYSTMPIGTRLYFWDEPQNEYDNKAVAVHREDDVKIGYLYKGRLRDMTLDFVQRKEAVMGQVTYNDGSSIRFCMDFFRDDPDDTDDMDDE